MSNTGRTTTAGSPLPLNPRDSGMLASEPIRDPRARSISVSLPWRRPKSSSLLSFPNELDGLPRPLYDVAIENSPDSSDVNTESRQSHSPNGLNTGNAHNGTPVTFRGIFRRASVSFRGIVQRRPSFLIENSTDEHASSSNSRPTTAHAAWNRFRQGKSFRQTRSFYGLDRSSHEQHSSTSTPRQQISSSFAAVPGSVDAPPVIPINTGAAAKASAAMQNEFLSRQALQNRWLHATTSSDDGNDRESGIGIVVSPLGSGAEVAEEEEEDSLAKDAYISRIDFVTQLPMELAIQTLANLDAAALSNVCLVSRAWYKVAGNQHIWRESCLRETTATFATSNGIVPNAGLGVPRALPTSNWKQIYKAKHELNQKWKAGKASPIYLNGHTDSIYCLQFDERKIVTGSRDKTIRVWDMNSLECKLVLGPPEVVNDEHLLVDMGRPTHFAARADGTKMFSSSPNTVSYPEHHKASILCLQYDDKILVTGSSDKTCIVYDVKAGYQPIRRLRYHTAAVLDLVFDDKYIVTCSKDVSICVWDRHTGNLVRQLRGHTGPVNAVQMRGNTIVSCSGDFSVKLWNIDTGKCIREFQGHTKGLACSQFSEDGRYVASAGNDEVIRIWDANTGECIRQMRAHDKLVRSLHIDSVSGRLVSGSYDTDIKVWDMATGHQLLDFPRWHSSWVLSAKSDYRRIVSSGQDPKILVMDFGAQVEGIELLQSEGLRVEFD